MPARPEPNPPAESEDAVIRHAERSALRRLMRLTDSENERVALRASEVLLRYARERRREDAQTTPASGEQEGVVGGTRRGFSLTNGKPPEGNVGVGGGAPLTRASRGERASPSGGLRPPLAGVKAIPHALLHPPAPKPAFRAVPLGVDSPGRSG